MQSCFYHIVCLVVKASISRVSDLIPAFGVGLFLGQIIPVTEKLVIRWLLCQAPGVMGIALRLVDPVSVHCDLAR